MESWLSSLLDLVYPPRCEACRENSRESLCPRCFSQIQFMKPQLGIHSVSVYDGVMRTAIHRFKFNKRKRLAQPLGILLVKYLSQTPLLNVKEIDGIVPVPLHPKRQQQRGFNQAELLANFVGRYHDLPVLPALSRIKNTRAQFDLPRAERFHNIKEAFKVHDPRMVRDKRLLLFDDIYTTGATIAECTRALKVAGAKRVEVLTLSRAVEDS